MLSKRQKPWYTNLYLADRFVGWHLMYIIQSVAERQNSFDANFGGGEQNGTLFGQ